VRQQRGLAPSTTPTPAYLLRAGTIILESPDHLAVVTKVYGTKRIKVWCRYVWQRESEVQWQLGTFDPDDLIEVAIQQRQTAR
jgi:hypothetical protein